MSDPDGRPDPMDKAYIEAEAILDDEGARAARRARVLAAVAQEPAAPAPAFLPAARRPTWRPARWLAAACVAGLGLLAVTQIYEPARRQAPIAPAPPLAAQPTAGRQGAVAPATSAAPASTAAVAPPAAPPASAPAIAKSAPPPPPPAVAMPPAPEAFPAAAPPPPPSGVVAEQRDRDEVTADQTGAAMQAPAARLAAPLAAPRAESLGGVPPSPAGRLRAAAAAGRTAEVEALLAHGVPVDAPDADGDTALMRSIQADQPAAAALLRRHGASLDRKNHAGESAKDLARAKGDAELDQALGLAR